jgi:signal transduction histidine kinase
MAELLSRKLEPEDERRKTLEMIFEEAAHLERAISRFLGFAKPFDLRLRRCRPEDIADRAYRLCMREAKKKDVQLEVVTDPGAPMIIADLEKASEALGNIVDNAIDAVPDQGGHVTLHTYFDDRDIVFVVTDNGPGLDLEPGQDPFRPFFTLKDGGTGLGLSIVKRIVSAHKGAVTYANLEQGGACFEVRIPIEG